MGMTIGSLFSGIGGLELGLERAGLGPVVWQCERSEFCRRVLAKHWPDAERFNDITELKSPPRVDVLCGGFPCQDISYVGLGAGLEWARSRLWFEYLRVIREVRPRFVVVENVSALLRRGVGHVLGGLAESGYDATWACIPAASVGAPHRRDRVFIVAHTNPGSDAKPHREPDIALAYVNSRPACKPHKAESGRVGVPRRRDADRLAGTPGTHWEAEPRVGRVADGVPGQLDRLGALGNAVVPQCAEVVGRAIMASLQGAE